VIYNNSDTTSVTIANLLLHYCTSSDTNSTFLRGIVIKSVIVQSWKNWKFYVEKVIRNDGFLRFF